MHTCSSFRLHSFSNIYSFLPVLPILVLYNPPNSAPICYTFWHLWLFSCAANQLHFPQLWSPCLKGAAVVMKGFTIRMTSCHNVDFPWVKVIVFFIRYWKRSCRIPDDAFGVSNIRPLHILELGMIRRGDQLPSLLIFHTRQIWKLSGICFV